MAFVPRLVRLRKGGKVSSHSLRDNIILAVLAMVIAGVSGLVGDLWADYRNKKEREFLEREKAAAEQEKKVYEQLYARLDSLHQITTKDAELAIENKMHEIKMQLEKDHRLTDEMLIIINKPDSNIVHISELNTIADSLRLVHKIK